MPPRKPRRVSYKATPAATRSRATHFNRADLTCYGCAFSEADIPFPGKPSGESPCLFCIRNPRHVQYVTEKHEWFDGSEPIKVPMDCYQTSDMRTQVSDWLDAARNDGADMIDRILETKGLLNAKIEEGG